MVSVIKFHYEADALRIANGTAYSLAAGVWSRDIGRVQRFAKKANAGTVWINTYGYTDVRLPWGGVRDSGFGREHGTAAIENFTEPKAVWMNLNVCESLENASGAQATKLDCTGKEGLYYWLGGVGHSRVNTPVPKLRPH